MEQKDFLELANTGINVDLSGLSGSGKTFILKQFIEEQKLLGKNVVVVGPTGIAAINIGGATIHSTFKIFGNQYGFINKQKVSWREIDIIIFDEKSMIGPDLFDFTDRIVRKYSENKDKPFGGKQIILCGDMAQLPPIYKNITKEEIETNLKLKEKYGTLIYSSADAYKNGNFKEIFLTKIFRQTDMRLLDILNKLREGDLSALNLLQQGGYNEKQEKESIHLIPYNNMVDQYNDKQFSLIKEKKYHYKGIISGKINIDNILTPEDLYLKRRCRVMLTKNIFNEGLYNGDLGIVTRLTDKHIEVFFDRVGTKYISQATRENREYEGKESIIIGTFTQIPLRLAYSLTIHKCIEGNQLVKGEHGRFKISNGQIGDKVYTAKGLYPIIEKQYMGKKDTIKITTNIGLELISTKDHKIFCGKDGENKYIESGELIIGDKLIIDRTIRNSGKEIELQFVNLSNRSKKVNYYTKYLDNDLSYYIGLLIGDGSYNYKKDGRIDLESMDIETTNFLQNFYDKLGINLLIIDKSKAKYKSKSKSHIIISKNFRDTLELNGLKYCIGKDKSIPEIFNNSTISNRCNLIKGLMDTDGTIGKTGIIIFTSTSKTLINQLQLMLLDLGIISYIHKMKKYSDNHNQSYQLIISGNNVLKYKDMIGFNISRHQKRLEDWCNKITGKTNIDYVINRNEIINEFKGLLGGRGIKGKGYTGIGDIKNILGYKGLSYTQLKFLIDFANSKGISLPIAELTYNNNYYYDSIISIENNGETDVYDLEINTEHNFVCQGIVVHNCQGLSIDKVIVHYIPGMTKEAVYVAVSRAKTYNELFLAK